MKIYTVRESNSGPIIIWGMFRHRGNEEEALNCAIDLIVSSEGENLDCTIIALEVEDWNRDFSPWETKCLGGDFQGNGIDTINYINEILIPGIRENYGNTREIYLMGYSLAGLFSVWGLFGISDVAGAAACSGSIWFPGFMDFVSKNIDKVMGKKIYLSLGGKENKTNNELMATVLDCTKELQEYLQENNRVAFEMNSGGHFADSGKRLAKAVKWIVTNCN